MPHSRKAHSRSGIWLLGDRNILCHSIFVQVIQFDVGNDVVRKQITMELRTLYDSHHAFIVRYFQVRSLLSELLWRT